MSVAHSVKRLLETEMSSIGNEPRNSMTKRTKFALVAATVLGISGFIAFAWYTAARLGADAADKRDLTLKVDAGERLYTAACASCHYNSGGTINWHRPSIALMSAINATEPTELVETILQGRQAAMPAYAAGFSDIDIALIAAHLRRSRTDAAPWPDLEKKVGAIRARSGNGGVWNMIFGAEQP